MKHNHFVLILLLASIVLSGALIGCASTKASSETDVSGLYFKNPQTEEKLLIEDWKYMGFGNSMPEWVIPALENNPEKLKSVAPELKNSEIVILQATGYNQDQAENSLIQQIKPKDFKLFDSFWVKISDIEKLYISVAVYYK